MKNKTYSQKGFTLVELLFSIAILGFMLTITLSTFIGVFRFYNWSKTTRTTQQSARDSLDIITREVRAGKIASVAQTQLCINRTDGFIYNNQQVRSELISLNSSGQFQIQYIDTINCPALDDNRIGMVVISSPNVQISDLKFSLVLGPTPATTPKSVIIFFEVINGTPVDGKCLPTDNFCDQAAFTTAVMER